VYSLHFDYNYFDYIVSMGILLVYKIRHYGGSDSDMYL
jgi:hypothetical protein